MRPYRGAPELKRIPETKENYRGKNAAGGRKCIFSQSQEYKQVKLYGLPRAWGRDYPNEGPVSYIGSIYKKRRLCATKTA